MVARKSTTIRVHLIRLRECPISQLAPQHWPAADQVSIVLEVAAPGVCLPLETIPQSTVSLIVELNKFHRAVTSIMTFLADLFDRFTIRHARVPAIAIRERPCFMTQLGKKFWWFVDREWVLDVVPSKHSGGLRLE